MKKSPLLFGFLLASALISQPAPSCAQSRKTAKSIPPAPLPSSISHAKKAYILDGQTTSQYFTKNGNQLAFDTLYAELKSWGRFELADSPTAADVVIELQYRPYSSGSTSYGVFNPSSNTVQTYNADSAGADFALVIYDAASKQQLWSRSDACGFARLPANQRKEVVKSVERLVESLRSRMQP